MTGAPALPDNLKSLRVLLVDDDEFVLDLVEDMLHELGVTNVSRAIDGNMALSITGTDEPPQLLVCDLSMPGMDGIEFFRHLADQRFAGGLILSSGSGQRLLKAVERLVQAHKLNFLGSLEKPVQQAALLSALIRFGSGAQKCSGYNLTQMLTPEEIRAGLDAGCMDVFFQPKVAVADRRVVGAECLARWHHKERGLISPFAFIPVAEEHGLIDSLTMAIFRKAMVYLGEWVRQGHDLKVAVNVSMANLSMLDLPGEFARTARQAGVEMSRVMLEMTESRLMSDITTSLEVITRLRLNGFGLSIDDFGTGYSSMEKLKLLPFTELKVDRAFVFGAAGDVVARAILESSVNLGHALGMSIVAEGVETQEDWDLVASLGCDVVQGYFIAEPMPAREFIAWKMRWEKQSRRA